MHRSRNLHTALRNISNSIQSMLSITPIGLHLTTSWAQAMLSYLTTQQVLPPPPPSKLTLRSLQITLISLWFPAQHRDTPRTNTPFFMKPQKPSVRYTKHLLKGFLLFGFFSAVRFSYRLSAQPNLHGLCKKTKFSEEDLTEEC